MKFLTQIFLLFAISTSANASNFFTSVHMGSSESGRQVFVAGSEKSLSDAKNKSLKMCTKKHDAKACEGLYAEKGEGYFAVVDSPDGSYGWSFDVSRQAAIDSAYANCKQHSKVDCKTKASVVEPSLSKATIAKVEANKYPPAPKGKPGVTTCASKCINGDCYITYSTGNMKRVQVPQEYDALNRKWYFPSPKC